MEHESKTKTKESLGNYMVVAQLAAMTKQIGLAVWPSLGLETIHQNPALVIGLTQKAQEP